jgi:pyruvate/2-oxoglutarate dehydrogenase complex dihydrolipoamide dehydrogenase (E3) component
VPEPQLYDLVLQAVGRTPNGKKIAADKAVHEAHVVAEVIAGELQRRFRAITAASDLPA